MSTEKDSYEFRALDFTEEDILFSPLVRYHFEMEAMEDLQKLDAGSFENAPEEASSVQKRAEKYFQKEEVFRTFRKGYYALQKVAVILVVLFIGFIYTAVQVEAVNKAVVGWLTNIYPTHTDLSVQMSGNSTIDLSQVQVNWIPDGLDLQRLSTVASASFVIYYENQSIASINCRKVSSNMDLNTENAKTTYLSLSEFDKTLLVEHNDAIIIVATNQNIVITITAFKKMGYDFSTGEIINILQNIDYCI